MILICDILVIRIEPLELFDEFEEWHMMQVSESSLKEKVNTLEVPGK